MATSTLIKRFGIGILLWSLLMLATLRFSFHFVSTTINLNPTITTYAAHTHANHTLAAVNIWSIQQCWSHLFFASFVQPKLEHTFANPRPKPLIPHCNATTLAALLNETYATVKAVKAEDKFSFHELISLRRSLMVLAHKSELKHAIESDGFYPRILKLFSKMETKFTEYKRVQYPIFSIHLPRSAGTTLCYQFQLSQFFQSSHHKLSDTAPKRAIYVNPAAMTNCNIGDGFPFYQYLVNSHSPKTCREQYAQSENFTMFARESPLYNNGDNRVSHPHLCNKFAYVLSVRSPIERILSWLKMDATFHWYNQSKPARTPPLQSDALELKAFITDFFAAMFDYSVNPPKQGPFHEIITVKGRADNNLIKVNNQWIRGYSNNALTRWIGYEFSERDLVNNELMKGMLAHSDIINSDDVHFRNAIDLMLRIDYVLNFASYGNDDSAREALRFAHAGNESGESESDDGHFIDNRNQPFWIENLWSDITRIQDPNNTDSVWNMFAAHMNRHFDTDVFDFNRDSMAQLKPKKNEIFAYLSESDWRTLYEQNYFDFRLYSLAKVIGEIDVKFDQM